MSEDQRIGTVLDGKYELTSLLGEGGMGAVYKAQHRLINRDLAVKFLHPQYADNDEVVTRFQREAQAAAKIGHENIIEITDMGTASDGAPYIVMEFLQGVDVKGLIETEGVQSVPRMANIMVQALAGLQAAHNVGIIHRDLKPENIFLISKSSNPDYVKLLDFGISKFKELETDGQKALTQTGTVLGTPHYMSPEQARGEQNLTPRSDIYAMGVILYQSLTGELPFDAPNYNALLIKILTEDPPLPEVLNPELPDDMADIIKIAMARDPNDRFADCNEFKSRLVPYIPGYGDATGAIDLSGVSHTAIRRPVRANTMTPLEMTQSGISPAKSKLPLILGGVAAAVLAVVIGIVMAGGGLKSNSKAAKPANVVAAAKPPAPEPAPEPVAEKTAAEPALKKADNQIELTVKATPETAVISIDGAVVSNPYTGFFVKSKVNRSITVSADGYKKHAEMVVFDKDLELAYELDKKATPKSRRRSSSKSVTKPARRAVEIKEKKTTTTPTPTKKPRRKIDYADPWS